MLDASRIKDITQISKYGKAQGYLLAKRYGLPTFSDFYIIESVDEAKELLNKFENQNNFCMRSDTLIGNNPIGIGGRNGNRETLLEYLKEIEEKSKLLNTKGVAIIYWNNSSFCPTYETEGSFYFDFKVGNTLAINYIGKGWDGSYLSHGSACSETYIIPWEEILFLKPSNRGKYLANKVTPYAYSKQRKSRIKDLIRQFGLTEKECESLIPKEYQGIKNGYFQEVLDKIVVPMYDARDLQRSYREYIPIAQIENGNVVCPEVILPTRLKYKQFSDEIGYKKTIRIKEGEDR